MARTAPVIFDGHNDILSKLASEGGLSRAARFMTGCDGAIDLVKARAGGFGGGFFAVFIWTQSKTGTNLGAMIDPPYDLPLPEPIAANDALPPALEQIAILKELERLGGLRICRSASDIRASFAQDKIAAILHVEGAEIIDPELHTLDMLYAAGLRSLGPVWSRSNIFGHGVPFRFPATPDTGPGLTEAGCRLIRKCNALGILVDLSHLNEAGFWDVSRISDKPLVATHSNAHAICPHARNLTDAQLRAIADSDGMVGVNFAAAFLREDGIMMPDMSLEKLLKHLDYLINILGEDRVGLGSDYDGAVVPEEITTVAELPRLRDAMARHGYDAALITKLCHGNWLRVLEKTWGS